MVDLVLCIIKEYDAKLNQEGGELVFKTF